MLDKAEVAWRIEALWDDRADAIQLGYRGRSKEQFDQTDSTNWGTDPLHADYLPVLMYLHSGVWHDRHLAKGRMLGDVLVSADLRALLSENDPEGVHFDPVELELGDGAVVSDRYSMLKVPRMLEALVPEKSSVREFRSKRTGKVLGWNYVKNQPPTLNREVIGENHIWRLPNIVPTDIYVSDWLKTEMDRRGFGPFKALPAPLD
ncbi:imm11 family protein [Jannaschia aquimarina]|uniref:Immunity MXAN-0049 protein domain-containing protein n=1 Tax=Jannaschia aquimarina TaxID=935700 RepID=A0A0D1EK49_9RHOB|nr:DUF1629 domain-containing protein [Jannaschia aquimarina]KIT16185.1 hypothetical protein jaqu_20760 [Jannaschia aquimarina]SNT43962.1 hypothetical protein SAMN05421775_1252 [Jannaschia aquimarina]